MVERRQDPKVDEAEEGVPADLEGDPRAWTAEAVERYQRGHWAAAQAAASIACSLRLEMLTELLEELAPETEGAGNGWGLATERFKVTRVERAEGQ